MRGIMAAVIVLFALFGESRAQSAVEIGISNSASDVVMFIADRKGYFRAEGLAPKFTNFESAAKMVAPLGAGQLDIGGGAPSAGLYNAFARGIDIRIVADKGSAPPGFGFAPLVVRKDLFDNGRVRGLKDLKGLKLAIQAPGSGAGPILNEALKKGGLTWNDVEHVYLPYAQQVAALANKALDGGILSEPSATESERRGLIKRLMGNDEIYPNQTVAAILYGGAFIKNRPDVARAFMRAYVRAARDYNDAFDARGRLKGPQADEVVSILVNSTEIKDPDVHRSIVPNGCNPDGYVNMETLRNDLAFFRASGDVEGAVTVEQVVDNSFVDAAVRELGAYRPKAR